jgi:hypothetical protein
MDFIVKNPSKRSVIKTRLKIASTRAAQSDNADKNGLEEKNVKRIVKKLHFNHY